MSPDNSELQPASPRRCVPSVGSHRVRRVLAAKLPSRYTSALVACRHSALAASGEVRIFLRTTAIRKSETRTHPARFGQLRSSRTALQFAEWSTPCAWSLLRIPLQSRVYYS